MEETVTRNAGVIALAVWVVVTRNAGSVTNFKFGTSAAKKGSQAGRLQQIRLPKTEK